MDVASQAMFVMRGRCSGFTPSDNLARPMMETAKLHKTMDKEVSILEITLAPQAQTAFASGMLKWEPGLSKLYVNTQLVVNGASTAKSTNIMDSSIFKSVRLHRRMLFCATEMEQAGSPAKLILQDDASLMSFFLVLLPEPSGEASPWPPVRADLVNLHSYFLKNTKQQDRPLDVTQAGHMTVVLFTSAAQAMLTWRCQTKGHHGLSTRVVHVAFSLADLTKPCPGVTICNVPDESCLFTDYWTVSGEFNSVQAFLRGAAHVNYKKYGLSVNAEMDEDFLFKVLEIQASRPRVVIFMKYYYCMAFTFTLFSQCNENETCRKRQAQRDLDDEIEDLKGARSSLEE